MEFLVKMKLLFLKEIHLVKRRASSFLLRNTRVINSRERRICNRFM